MTTAYSETEDEFETTIAKLFAEVFDLDRVGVRDEFFDLGGDSMLAEVLSMRISEQTKHDFSPSQLVEYGSPKQIAELFREKKARNFASMDHHIEENRPPIFVVHGRGGFTMPAPAFVQALAKGQTLRMFELPGIRGGRCYDSVEDIASEYIRQLAEEYPEGPIFLAAFCAGALIATEMAAQLAESGRPPLQLVLLDPPIRQGTLGVGQIGAGPETPLLKAMLLRLLPMGVLCRYHVAKYQLVLQKKRREGSLKYAEFRFSSKAQAKLYVAFHCYEPRPYEGPVTILSSYGSSRAYRGGIRLRELLPKLQIDLVSERHHNIGSNVSAAKSMQAVFNSALELCEIVATSATKSDPTPSRHKKAEP